MLAPSALLQPGPDQVLAKLSAERIVSGRAAKNYILLILRVNIVWPIQIPLRVGHTISPCGEANQRRKRRQFSKQLTGFCSYGCTYTLSPVMTCDSSTLAAFHEQRRIRRSISGLHILNQGVNALQSSAQIQFILPCLSYIASVREMTCLSH